MLNRQSPPTRYWAAVAAQVAGINLFIAVGLLAFPFSQQDISLGLKFIVGGMLVVLMFSLVAFIFPFRRTWRRQHRTFIHEDVDVMIFALFLIDICVHTFLVCQEGGLVRSMFLPVFFLIPIAYTLVERAERMRRLVWVFAITVLSMCICYRVSSLVTTIQLRKLPLSQIPITDFSLSAVPGNYDRALLITSLASLIIPTMQIKIIQFLRRKEAN
jgi:hypothetical protein